MSYVLPFFVVVVLVVVLVVVCVVVFGVVISGTAPNHKNTLLKVSGGSFVAIG
jgi:hypothetical protein